MAFATIHTTRTMYIIIMFKKNCLIGKTNQTTMLELELQVLPLHKKNNQITVVYFFSLISKNKIILRQMES